MEHNHKAVMEMLEPFLVDQERVYVCDLKPGTLFVYSVDGGDEVQLCMLMEATGWGHSRAVMLTEDYGEIMLHASEKCVALTPVKTKHTITSVGFLGSFRAYLDVPEEEAKRRYAESEPMLDNVNVKTIEIEDEFYTYEVGKA